MKGVSAVIAVILLLLITIAIVSIASFFLLRTAQTTANETQAGAQRETSAITTSFVIESANENKVYLRNTGISDLSNLNFYVDGKQVGFTGPASIGPNQVGAYTLDDSKVPDTGSIRVTSTGPSQEESVDFYGKYIVGHWKFDEGSGSLVSDSSGNGNDGTVVGAAWVPGYSGTALDFAGGNNYAVINNATDFNFGYPITIDLRVYLTQLKPEFKIISNRGPNGRATFEIGGHLEDNFTYSFTDTSAQNHSFESQAALSPLQWQHLVVSFNGTQVKMFMDGVIVYTVNTTAKPGPSAGKLQISGFNTTTKTYGGRIDEVKIYRTDRTFDMT